MPLRGDMQSVKTKQATGTSRSTTPGHQKQWKRRVSCVYRCMHDRRMYQRGTVAVEIKGGYEGYGDMPSVAEGSYGAASGRTG
eukprot:scaffold35728_cov69-Attheya_sp.AAC.1